MKITDKITEYTARTVDSEGFMWIDSMDSLSKILGKNHGKKMNIKFTSPNCPGIQFTCVRRNRSYKKARYEFTKKRLVITDYGNANLDPREINVVFTDAPQIRRIRKSA